MNKSNVIEPEEREGISDPLTELLREGAQRFSSRTGIADRSGTGNGSDSQGPCKDRGSGDVSVRTGAALCAENEITGSRAAMVVSEGRQQRRDG